MPPNSSNMRIIPANEASFDDLQAVFGSRGAAANCQCQRNKLARGEAFRYMSVEERRERLCQQADCGNPRATDTSGLVAYAGDEPVGWIAVEPRPAYQGLVRNSNKAAWVGRQEDRADPSVWAITCVFVRAGHRGRRISRELVQAAVTHARTRGARVLEAYPIVAAPGEQITWDEIHPGTPSMFEAAGMRQVHAPSKRRRVMRIEFQGQATS